MYELYTVNMWHGSKSRHYDTLQEVLRVLIDEHYSFKWDYKSGREVLHENVLGGLAQVFHEGRDITREICPKGHNLTVLY